MDVRVDNHGSVVILTGTSDDGKLWLHMNLNHAQRWGQAGYVVEPRYVDDIIAGLQADGLEVGS